MSNLFRLDGQSVLVTGALGGIGLATARALLEQGASVVLCDQAPVSDVLLAELGPNARSAVCDVTDRRAVEQLFRDFPNTDGLVLSAGILPFDDWMDEQWDASFDRVMAVNVRGSINLARVFFPAMCERRSGKIVFVGSVAGRMGGMQAGPHYAASKGAVHALVRWFAQRAAPNGVNVNGIAPGSIATEMLAGKPFDTSRVPMGRMGMADEVAWPIAFLCSSASNYMNGAVMDVNGGLIFS
ncbi:MAG: SDR family oxidoreductase [Hydrogenophaga sp.]|uniref:SDR family NAD(P)-dependent oxidoreductase n=1 Tax=Hydrogenophaga sp. TaxID=1904254 RepID=UPI00260F4F89|nr:SDR family oxidoreductase [Hydrogenophaga sp.]MCV0437469.1 SDR family oxidoreductase [Hydrogenophaga sp.]